MTKEELIDLTLKEIRDSRYSNPTEESGGQDADDYESVALATLTERLPEGEIKTCQDLSTGVECCYICHGLYFYYEMYLEQLPTGDVSWICCSVRSELRNPGHADEAQNQELIDLEEALGGGLRKKDQADQPAKSREEEEGA
jgi:hypothetical protein